MRDLNSSNPTPRQKRLSLWSELGTIIRLSSPQPTARVRLLLWSIYWQMLYGLQEISGSTMSGLKTGPILRECATLLIRSWSKRLDRFTKRLLSGGRKVSGGVKRLIRDISHSITQMAGLLTSSPLTKMLSSLKGERSA